MDLKIQNQSITQQSSHIRELVMLSNVVNGVLLNETRNWRGWGSFIARL